MMQEALMKDGNELIDLGGCLISLSLSLSLCLFLSRFLFLLDYFSDAKRVSV